ncbi:MAG: phosphoribosylaminoimidazolesuccinocarboxamide synthase [Proteobacteria bacterium]|nr:MAG: phosphoribosylaminoimidazolesuccinocarboxamide synthase [Pseudomonadota bacterium]
MSQPIQQLQNYPLIAQGKVRDIYAIDEQHMLIVTTDRLSAFDVILPQPIPDKGKVLLQVSKFWFDKLSHVIANHLTDIDIDELSINDEEAAYLTGRAVVVKHLRPLPIEAIVRGYLIGSGWKDYQKTGEVCGIKLPENLKQASKLPQAIFTPSSKAEVGDHDENISYAVMEQRIGTELAAQVKATSLQLYTEAAEYARARGIIIADTKFEFGLDENDKLVLIDEILTPDSSRFWPADEYREGTSPPSFDKQFVRDYLETLDWDKTPPGPELPDDILARTAEKYQEVARRLTKAE